MLLLFTLHMDVAELACFTRVVGMCGKCMMSREVMHIYTWNRPGHTERRIQVCLLPFFSFLLIFGRLP